MEILWWQVLLLTLYAGYQIWDELHLYSSISQPVFAGLIAGLIMGDVTTGLIIGGSMQLTILGVGTFGGASRIDANSGTILAVAFSCIRYAANSSNCNISCTCCEFDDSNRYSSSIYKHILCTSYRRKNRTNGL